MSRFIHRPNIPDVNALSKVNRVSDYKPTFTGGTIHRCLKSLDSTQKTLVFFLATDCIYTGLTVSGPFLTVSVGLTLHCSEIFKRYTEQTLPSKLLCRQHFSMILVDANDSQHNFQVINP